MTQFQDHYRTGERRYRKMLRSISTHNFIHFIEPQRLEFKDGTNYVVGGNSTGKSAIFELIRRSLSNDINTTSSSFTVDLSIAYSVCHFKIPDDKKQHFLCNPTDIISGLFVEKANKSDERQRPYYYYYKVLVMINESNNVDILISKFEGLNSCNPDQLRPPIYLYLSKDGTSGSIKDVISEGSHDTYNNSIESLFEEIKQKSCSDESHCNKNKFDKIFKSLEDGYVGVMPMRSIGPLQWTRSKNNCHTKRMENYKIASKSAEIINDLLDSDQTDKDQLAEYHKMLVAPYRFKKEEGLVFMYNEEGATTIKKDLLKTPEGIIEAEQLILLLSQKNLFTITLEEPDRGMHPQMITKMRDWVLKKVKNKTVLVISHNPAILDHAVIDRTYICSKSIQSGNISHSVLKFPAGYRKYGRMEEMKNLLFCERILFVEGFTDKIFMEAIFDVLINDSEMHDQNLGKKNTINNEEFRKYISTIHVAELVDGKGSGPKKMEFCNKLKRECCIVYDFDEAKKSTKKGADTKDKLRVQYGKFDEEFKDNTAFITNSDAVQRFTSACDEASTFIWIEGALEKVINTVANDMSSAIKESLEIPISKKNFKTWKHNLVEKSDSDIALLAKKLLLSSGEVGRFLFFLRNMMESKTIQANRIRSEKRKRSLDNEKCESKRKPIEEHACEDEETIEDTEQESKTGISQDVNMMSI